jgi:hypothetical protein
MRPIRLHQQNNVSGAKAFGGTLHAAPEIEDSGDGPI